MGEIIVITSGKGGVGKSTVTANLGARLALSGAACALVDMDMGLRCLDVMLGLENKIVYDLADVAEGMCRVKQALVKHPQIPGLSLLSAAQSRGSDAVSQRQLEKALDQMREHFDFILIDCPAGVGRGFRNAAAGANRALIVETPDVVAMRDAERVVGLLGRMDLPKPALILNRLLPEHMPPDSAVSPEAFVQRLETELIGLVPEDPTAARRALADETDARETGPAGQAFARIARRLRGEKVAFPAIKRPNLRQRLWAAIRPYEVR